MPRTVREYSVFIASPADLLNERRIVKQVIQDWNNNSRQTLGVRLLPVMWETNSTPRMGAEPQTIINDELLDDCEILVGMFWTRIGSPTKNAKSGTVEEIRRFIDAEKPTLIYFSSVPIDPNRIDLAQHQELREYKSSISKNGILGDFNNAEELRTKLLDDLTRTITRLEKEIIQPHISAKPPTDIDDVGEDNHKFTVDIKLIAYEELPQQDRRIWEARGTNHIMDSGVTSIPPLAIISCAKGLYRESIKTTDDLRQEFLSGQRAAMRRDKISESVKKAASRLPKDGFK